MNLAQAASRWLALFAHRLFVASLLLASPGLAWSQEAPDPAAAETVASPQIVATTAKVQLNVGEELLFTISATFLDGDGALYDIELDEAELPDGYEVLDTGDSEQIKAAVPGSQAAVVAKSRYYKLKASEDGVWVLPKARLVSAKGASQSYGETSPIYTIVSAASSTPGTAASQQPFFRLLPPTPAKKGGEPLPFFQITGITSQYRIVLWRLLAFAAIAAALAWLAFAFRQHRPAPLAAPPPRRVTIAELRSELDDAGYRDRSPDQIKESYDAIRAALMSYAYHVLGHDFRAKMPAELMGQRGFLDLPHQQRFSAVLATCDSVRFCPEELAQRDKLAETVAAAKEVVIDPRDFSPETDGLPPADDEEEAS